MDIPQSSKMQRWMDVGENLHESFSVKVDVFVRGSAAVWTSAYGDGLCLVVCVCLCFVEGSMRTPQSWHNSNLAGKQEKKPSWGCSRERAWLSERHQKNIPGNTRPHSALLRIEIPHSLSVAMWSTALDCRGLWYVGERALSTQGILHLLLMLKQRYSSHVRYQLTDVCFQKGGSSTPSVSER